MPIPRGTRIGVNEIVGLIGSGGMGEVYCATDTRLGRDVAIKVLANRLSQDPIIRARIEREARLLASLNHPNIAIIYSVEEYEGSPAIVMELIEGETLAFKLCDGPLPVEQAVRIARQVAEALTAAHERDIVHRDLKPANIHVRPDGTAKVLDFGLAKALVQSDTRLSTPSVTTTGSVLGTATYMSPEQARGQDVDHRADIWSFGCVLFEMLCGQPPFGGVSLADTVVSVLTTEPEWARLPESTPPRFRSLIEQCLEKDVTRRLPDLRDFTDRPPAGWQRRLQQMRRSRARLLTAAAILAMTVGFGWMLWTLVDRDPPAPPLRKFAVIAAGLGDDPYAYSDSVGPGSGVVISPDGKRIVYPASGRLWVRELSQLDARELDGTAGAGAPSWSPDSEWVAYAVGDQLRKSPIDGGPAVTITTLTGRFIDGAGSGWLPDGVVFYSAGNDGVWRVSSGGGTPQRVIDVEKGLLHYRDVSVAGGRVLFVSNHISGGSSIDIIEDGQRRTLLEPTQQVWIRHPTYSRTGHIIFQRTGDTAPGVYAVAVNPETFLPAGTPFLVAARGLRPSVAADGTLVYVTDDRWGLRGLSLVNRDGKVVKDVGGPRATVSQPTLSPTDDRVVFMSKVDDRDELLVLDVESGRERQLTKAGTRGDPAWSPDGKSVYFSCGASGRDGGVCELAADGSGTQKIVVPGASHPHATPDGRALAHILLDPATRTDVWATTLDGSAPPRAIRRSPGFDFHPRVSPDGKWIAYASTESKQAEVYVADYPAARRRWQLSTATAAHPRWHPRGGELFFVDGDGRLQSVAVGDQGPAAKPSVVLNGAGLRLHLLSGYSVSGDGSFLAVRDVERGTTKPRITIVENWFAEFSATK